MLAKVYNVRCGEGGDWLKHFHTQWPPLPGSQGVVGIGWWKLGSFLGYADSEEDAAALKILMEKAYPEKPSKLAGRDARSILRFQYTIKIGDWVLTPSKGYDFILVGKVTGEYREALSAELPERIWHLRDVIWNAVVPNTDARFRSLMGSSGRQTTTINRNFTSIQLEAMFSSQT